MRSLVVLDPGLLATVQDLGRPGGSHLGVSSCGAADPLSLVVGNRLVGNDDGAAAVEWTLKGGRVRLEDDAVLALSGAPAPATLATPDGRIREVAPRAAFVAPAGSTLRIPAPIRGVRTYLCVGGGVALPRVLGSASTHVASGIGGLGGRALAAGDRLPLGEARPDAPRRSPGAGVRALLDDALSRPTLRAVPGAQAAAFSDAAAATFWSTTFTVTDRSDRMGVRLDGPFVAPPGGGTMTTEGMPWGAVQVPGEGRPIVLAADRPTTGGYPVIACVATVDLPRLGQLRPHESVRFERVPLDLARAAARAAAAVLDREMPRP